MAPAKRKTTKRRRRSGVEVAVAQVMKEARKEKLEFEKRLSSMLSEALNLDVIVKIKPAAVTKAVAAARKRVSSKSGPYYDDLEQIFDGSNAILAKKPRK